MAKKELKKIANKKGTSKSLVSQKGKKGEVSPSEENPFDFGGLPARNLKKNLGC
jgi:hypothetical protein